VSNQQGCLTVFRKEEEQGKYAYNFTHGLKKGKKKEIQTPTQAIQAAIQLCFLTSSMQSHQLTRSSSRDPMLSSFGIRIKNI